ncbi:hypothetical protein JCM4814A_52810 [Streptomyces phaeofaciens JCM 4814]|uniref:Uncharacterized protein n=1 Tax=Streptomyces phaeofaciens TaxID=68254 RepID=A0A918HTB0_9ACTN|nr:hypothetical protein [Streptomyces phaeofaciens]GGU01092.1 hypothetical protein GCM10010226_92230 [Streptomyces phaeofaciens]
MLLGIGVETAVVVLTPIVLEVCRRLWESLCAEAASATVRAGQVRAEELVSRLRSRFGRGGDERPEGAEGPAAAFTPEHLRELHRLVTRQAGAMGLPEEQRRLMADAVVGALAGPDTSGRDELDPTQEPEGHVPAGQVDASRPSEGQAAASQTPEGQTQAQQGSEGRAQAQQGSEGQTQAHAPALAPQPLPQELG